MGRFSGHLRANVVGYVALFVALGGTGAWAAAEIGSSDIKPDAVKKRHINENAVRGSHIRDGAVRSADIGDGSLLSADIFDGTLTGGEVADGSLTGGDVAADSITGDDIDESTLQLPDEVSGRHVHSAANTTGTVIALPGLGEVDFTCSNDDPPKVSFQFENASGGTLRVYEDRSDSDPTVTDLADTLKTTATPPDIVDRVDYGIASTSPTTEETFATVTMYGSGRSGPAGPAICSLEGQAILAE